MELTKAEVEALREENQHTPLTKLDTDALCDLALRAVSPREAKAGELEEGPTMATLTTVMDERDAALAEAQMWERMANDTELNKEWYRGLVMGIGSQFGKAAYTADDGKVGPDVLIAKVPELVNAALAEAEKLRAALEKAKFSIGVARDLGLKELPASQNVMHTWTKAIEACDAALQNANKTEGVEG